MVYCHHSRDCFVEGMLMPTKHPQTPYVSLASPLCPVEFNVLIVTAVLCSVA